MRENECENSMSCYMKELMEDLECIMEMWTLVRKLEEKLYRRSQYLQCELTSLPQRSRGTNIDYNDIEF